MAPLPGYAVNMMPMQTDREHMPPVTDEAASGQTQRVVFSDPEPIRAVAFRAPDDASTAAQAPVFLSPF